MKITFEKFDKDYREFYNIKGRYSIRTESEMQEVIYDLYDTDSFEIDYDNGLLIIG